MNISRSYCQSPLGILEISCSENNLVGLKFVEQELLPSSPNLPRLHQEVRHQLKAYFEGKRKSFDLPFGFSGTDFQKKVWQALIEIPYGETRTYQDIAKAIGNPKAARAVGMANNKNSIAIVVPCHRVIGSNGKLTGYAGGLEIKAKLLRLEQALFIDYQRKNLEP